MKLSKTEQKILDKLKERLNDKYKSEKEIIIDTTRECIACHKLAKKGLVTVKVYNETSSYIKRTPFGRDYYSKTGTSTSVGVQLIQN